MKASAGNGSPGDTFYGRKLGRADFQVSHTHGLNTDMSPERGSPIASWKQRKGLNHLQLYIIHDKIDVHHPQRIF